MYQPNKKNMAEKKYSTDKVSATRYMSYSLFKRYKKELKNNYSDRFVAVNLWQSKFGEISVEAIYDLYSQKFNVKHWNMKKYSFSNCLNALRKLEDPDYIAPEFGSGE